MELKHKTHSTVPLRELTKPSPGLYNIIVPIMMRSHCQTSTQTQTTMGSTVICVRVGVWQCERTIKVIVKV